jgi:hypothetical protein
VTDYESALTNATSVRKNTNENVKKTQPPSLVDYCDSEKTWPFITFCGTNSEFTRMLIVDTVPFLGITPRPELKDLTSDFKAVYYSFVGRPFCHI